MQSGSNWNYGWAAVNQPVASRIHPPAAAAAAGERVDEAINVEHRPPSSTGRSSIDEAEIDQAPSSYTLVPRQQDEGASSTSPAAAPLSECMIRRSQLQAQASDLEGQMAAAASSLPLSEQEVAALRRAHRTLVQHILALDIESKHLTGVIDGLETEVITDSFVAREIGAVATITGVAWTIDRLGRTMTRSKIPARALVLGTVAVIGYRLVHSSYRRLVSLLQANRKIRKQLQEDWHVCEERIKIMRDLAESGPMGQGQEGVGCMWRPHRQRRDLGGPSALNGRGSPGSREGDGIRAL